MSHTPRIGHAPIALRRVDGYSGIAQPGDYYWQIVNDSRYIVLAVPSPASPGFTFNNLPVSEGDNVQGEAWGWDGNEDCPTLTPSIHAVGHWHGWLKAGVLTEA